MNSRLRLPMSYHCEMGHSFWLSVIFADHFIFCLILGYLELIYIAYLFCFIWSNVRVRPNKTNFFLCAIFSIFSTTIRFLFTIPTCMYSSLNHFTPVTVFPVRAKVQKDRYRVSTISTMIDSD